MTFTKEQICFSFEKMKKMRRALKEKGLISINPLQMDTYLSFVECIIQGSITYKLKPRSKLTVIRVDNRLH